MLGIPMLLIVMVIDRPLPLKVAVLLVVAPRAVEKVIVAGDIASDVFLKLVAVVIPRLQLLAEGALLQAHEIAPVDSP